MVRPTLGKAGTQWAFESMRQLALVGLNYGDSGAMRFSGEDCAADHVIRSLKRRFPAEAHIIFFDVGANVGNYSLMVAPKLANAFPHGKIHAFEPSGCTFDALTQKLHGVDTVEVHKLAFSDHPGRSTLFQIFPGSGLASLYNREGGSLKQYGMKTTSSEEVLLSTVDVFSQENHIDHIHFLKIDTEGAEFKVLQGAQVMLDGGGIDNIQFEFSEGCLDSRTFLKDFFELLGGRYKLSRILRNGLEPMPKYLPKFEVFACANYLAEAI
jgi:FkbM family methyltransferase